MSDLLPRTTLPAEILAYIIELVIITSTPSPRTIAPASATNTSCFTTPLASSSTSDWCSTSSLLLVSKFFFSVAHPLLLRTLTLDSTRAGLAFFRSETADKWLNKVQNGWFGNVSALQRHAGTSIDPVEWRLRQAAWYEECPGGFVVGHAYASRNKAKKTSERAERERKYRSVSVYWAEEELLEEVSDPDRSSSSESDDATDQDQPVPLWQQSSAMARSLPSHTTTSFGYRPTTPRPSTLRRSSHQASSTSWDASHSHPHEPAWQTLYSRPRRSSPGRSRSQASSCAMNGTGSSQGGTESPIGPSEGDLDPWDMQDAQERLTALANASSDHQDAVTSGDSLQSSVVNIALDSPPPMSASPTWFTLHNHARRREIYAYHICTATLEAFIQPLLSSIRTLRLITLTLYPGHLLDDDKLEHMLRRILSASESPRLETLLIRIVFDAATAGSRTRRFERTKTIAGAVNRIGDERVRVMLVNASVGEGELVESRSDQADEIWSPISRKAITSTKEGWWSRVLQQNHYTAQQEQTQLSSTPDSTNLTVPEEHQHQFNNWSMFFPPHRHADPTHLVNLIHHSDPWPDCPSPV